MCMNICRRGILKLIWEIVFVLNISSVPKTLAALKFIVTTRGKRELEIKSIQFNLFQ